MLKATFHTRRMPDGDIAATVLAHLAEHGTTTTGALWLLFETVPVDPDTLKASRDGRYVSLGRLISVLKALREAGEIYELREPYGGRTRRLWNIDGFGGMRNRSRRAEPGVPDGAAIPATA